jgi:hypothetical protein
MSSKTLREELRQQIRAPLEPQLIYLAVKLGIPELLRDGPQNSADLAQQLAVHAPSLHRALRGMAILDLVREEGEQRFSLTARGALLQRDHPESLADDALITGELLPAWGGLLRSVQTGEPAFDTITNHAWDVTSAGRGLSQRAATAILDGCPDEQISVDVTWPLHLWLSGAFSIGYRELEGLEFETPDRYTPEVAAAGSLTLWMQQIDADPQRWAHRLNIARIQTEAMIPYRRSDTYLAE